MQIWRRAGADLPLSRASRTTLDAWIDGVDTASSSHYEVCYFREPVVLCQPIIETLQALRGSMRPKGPLVLSRTLSRQPDLIAILVPRGPRGPV